MFICIEVADRKTEEAFIELPVRLYRGNPYWIRPLNDDICKVFDREKNPCFREGGECVRWLLRNEEGEYVGRAPITKIDTTTGFVSIYRL